MPSQEYRKSLEDQKIKSFINEKSNNIAFGENLFNQLVDTLSKQEAKQRGLMTDYVVNFLQNSHSKISYTSLKYILN